MQRKFIFFLLLLLSLFHAINNYIVLALDSSPLIGHPGLYFTHSCQLFNILQNNSLSDLFSAIFNINSIYPPLLYISPLPFYLLFGNSPDTAILIISTLYFTLLILALYLLGREFTDVKTSLLATFLCSFFPAIFGFSRMFLMAVPSVALIVTTTYLMVRSRCFKHFGFSLAFGLTLGLAMLMKKYNIITFAGIFTGYFIDNRRQITKRSILNLFFAMIVCSLLAAPWYIAHFEDHIKILEIGRSIKGVVPATVDPSVFPSFKNLLIYDQLGIVFFMLFVNAFILVLIRRKTTFMLLLWIAWPYFLYSAICIEKSSRYTLPILPAIAFIIALGIKELFTIVRFKLSRLFKVSLISMLLFYSIFSYFNLTYGQKIQQFSCDNHEIRFFYQGFRSPLYTNFDMRLLTRHFKDNDHGQVILDASGCTYILNDALPYYLVSNSRRITYYRLDYESERVVQTFDRRIKTAKFLIFYSYDGTDTPNDFHNIENGPIERIQRIIDTFKSTYIDEFELIEKIYENDEACERVFLLYKRRS